MVLCYNVPFVIFWSLYNLGSFSALILKIFISNKVEISHFVIQSEKCKIYFNNALCKGS